MLCDKCHENQATVFVSNDINGMKIEYHLCEKCAQSQGMTLDGLFKAYLDDVFLSPSPAPKKPSLVCGTCGETFEEFRRIGRLGCADCYSTFKNELDAIFRKVQSDTKHSGKRPSSLVSIAATEIEATQPNNLENMRVQLKQAIDSEDFETAARLRDEIRALERGESHE